MHLVVVTKSVVCKDRLVLLGRFYSDLIMKPVSYLCGRNGRLEGVTSQCNSEPFVYNYSWNKYSQSAKVTSILRQSLTLVWSVSLEHCCWYPHPSRKVTEVLIFWKRVDSM